MTVITTPTNSERAFLAQSKVPHEYHDAAIHLLRAFSQYTGWPIEALNPDDDTESMAKAIFLGFDMQNIESILEASTGRELARLAEKLPVFRPVRSPLPEHRPPLNFGDWIRRAAPVLHHELHGRPQPMSSLGTEAEIPRVAAIHHADAARKSESILLHIFSEAAVLIIFFLMLILVLAAIGWAHYHF